MPPPPPGLCNARGNMHVHSHARSACMQLCMRPACIRACVCLGLGLVKTRRAHRTLPCVPLGAVGHTCVGCEQSLVGSVSERHISKCPWAAQCHEHASVCWRGNHRAAQVRRSKAGNQAHARFVAICLVTSRGVDQREISHEAACSPSALESYTHA